MKKHICHCILLTIIVLAIAVFSSADTNLSDMSFEELISLQKQVNTALWNSEGWKEVTVPIGIYKIGEEIPAGKWTIKSSDKMGSYITVGKKFTEGEVKNFVFYSAIETEANLILEEGTYIEVKYNPIVFTPYVVSFRFN